MAQPQACGLGSYQTKTGHKLIDCELCKFNYYNEKVINATSPSACKSCPTGTYTLSKGAKSDTQCIDKPFSCTAKSEYVGGKNGNKCLGCPAGYVGDDVGVSCSLCPRGFYQDQTGQGTCKECGTTLCENNLGATSANPITSPTFSLIAPSTNDSDVRTTETSKDATETVTKDQLSNPDGLDGNTADALNIVFALIVLTIVLSHRWCPIKFRV